MSEKPCKICRLEKHREVLEDMLDVVEEFQPYHTDMVLKVLLNETSIRDRMEAIRDSFPTMVKADGEEALSKM